MLTFVDYLVRVEHLTILDIPHEIDSCILKMAAYNQPFTRILIDFGGVVALYTVSGVPVDPHLINVDFCSTQNKSIHFGDVNTLTYQEKVTYLH